MFRFRKIKLPKQGLQYFFTYMQWRIFQGHPLGYFKIVLLNRISRFQNMAGRQIIVLFQNSFDMSKRNEKFDLDQ